MRTLIARLTLAATVTLLPACGPRAGVNDAAGPIGPSPRANAALAYDATRGKLVLFGGGAATWLGDTWTWDGRAWQQESPALSPSPRGAAAMAYDPTSGLVVLFGGISGGSGATDTWVWNGTTWTQLHPSATPPATFGRAFMNFDPVSQHLILLTDPDQAGTPRDETWEWTGATWTLIDSHGPIGEGPGGLDQNPPAGVDPRPRVGGTFDPATAFGLDPVRNQLMAVQRVRYADAPVQGVVTWEWDGHQWAPLQTSSPAFPAVHDDLSDPVLAPAPDGRSVLLVDLHGAWQWDGTRWAPMPFSPPSRGRAAFAFDAKAGHDLLVGGVAATDPGGLYGDTWTWTGAAWQQAAGPAGRQAAQYPSSSPPPGGISQERAIAIARHAAAETEGPRIAPVIQARLARAGTFGNVSPTAATWEWGVSFRVDQTLVGHGPPGSPAKHQVHSVAVFIDYLSGEVLETSWPAPKILGGEGG
ncbi:MAG: hypothetical protein E6J01_08655 [Chloroflexi bacterium]|nr:MAG: hypothetical protein E6J01_08655 [Chloroflexota bacterium]